MIQIKRLDRFGLLLREASINKIKRARQYVVSDE